MPGETKKTEQRRRCNTVFAIFLMEPKLRVRLQEWTEMIRTYKEDIPRSIMYR